MKKLSLLFVLISVMFTAMAGSRAGAPARIQDGEFYADQYYIFQRSNKGAAVDPTTHTACVPQQGIFEVAIAEGGQLFYIKNIVYGSEQEFGNYWVEAYLDTNLLCVPLGQVIAVKNRNGSFVKSNRQAVLAWGTVSYNAITGETTFVRDLTVDMVYYNLDNGNIQIENTSGPIVLQPQDDLSYNACGLGIVWEDENNSEDYDWAGYCEWNSEIFTDPFVMNWQPEGEVKTYNRTSDCIHYSDGSINKASESTYSCEKLADKGEIVFDRDGRTVYFNDPLLSMKLNSWVIGTLSDDGRFITVNLPQYLYCYAADQYSYWYEWPIHDCISLKLAESYVQKTNQAVDELNVLPWIEFHFITFAVKDNTISLQDTWADFDAPYPDNYSAKGIYAYDTHNNVGAIEANIVYTLDNDVPEPTEKTSDPVINGYPLNNGKAYRVEITESEPSTIYYRMKESDDSYTAWTVYNTPLVFNIPGQYCIEAYAQANGKLPSEIVPYEFEISSLSGISEMVTDKQMVSRRYFNAMGQEIQNPVGLTIIVTTYSDGTSTAVKVVK